MDFQVSQIEDVESLGTLTSVIASGGGPGVFPVDNSLIDVRQYTSYYLELTDNVGVTTNFDYLSVTRLWYADSGGSNVLFEDEYVLLGDGTGAFGANNLLTMMQDAMHGPYMQILMQAFGPQNSSVVMGLFGTTRALLSPSVRSVSGRGSQSDVLAGVLFGEIGINLAAGVGQNFIVAPWVGTAQVTVRNLGANPVTVNMAYNTGIVYNTWTVAAGASDTRTVIIPARQNFVGLVSTAGSANVQLFVIKGQQTNA